MTRNGSTTLRSYVVRDDRGRWLARAVICDDGYFSATSNVGGYAFWWGDAGRCFRSFLCEVEWDYLCGKIAPGDDYYGPETERNIRRTILRRRRDGDLPRDQARREWDNLDEHDFEHEHGFLAWLDDTQLDDAYELAEHGYDRRAVAFAREVWPHFQRMLRAELAAERGQAAVAAVGGT